MATFYLTPYNSGSGPSQSWIIANAPIIVNDGSQNYGAYTRYGNLDVYVAMFDNSGSDNFIICSTASASVRLMTATGYPGFWTEVSTNTTYHNFQYGTFTGGGRPLTSLVPKFDSLNDALAYFDVLINTPSVDVANLSGIFVGSTEIQKVILNGATIYQKAAAGFQVTVQQDPLSATSGGAVIKIYDGQSSSGTLLDTLATTDFDAHTYNVTSGYIAICSINLESYGTVSGGVSYVGETTSGETGWYYSVTADGSITDFAFVCLTGDALVTMADGTQKRLDEIEIGDSVLSLDWETKELIARKVIFTDKDENKSFTEFDRWIFADGTEIKTVHRHEFYNVEKGGMAYMDEWKIGDHAYRIDGSKVSLVGHENVKETVKHYKITLEGDTNYFVHGLLNGDRNCPKEKI